MVVPKSPYYQSIFFLMILTVLLPSVSALSCGGQVNEDAVLEEDLLCEGGGVIINRSHISLDCGGKRMVGRGTGNGIEVWGTGVTIKNCVVDGFENGLLITKVSSVSIENSALTNNLIGAHVFEAVDVVFKKNIVANNSFYGIYVKDSLNVGTENNLFSQNRDDVYSLVTEIEPEPEGEKEEASKEIRSEQEKEPETKKITIPQSFDVPIELSQKSAERLDAKKVVIIGENKTSYVLSLIAKRNLKKIGVTEEIPKEVASSSKEIRSETPFSVVREGDAKKGPTIRFELADIKQGVRKTVTYTLSKEVLSDFALRPTTFILLEEAINPSSLWIIRILFSLTLMLLACSIYFAKALHSHRHFFAHLVVFCTGIFLFILVNLKIEVVVSEWVSNVVVSTILTIAVVGLGILNLKYAREFLHKSKEQRNVEELEF